MSIETYGRYQLVKKLATGGMAQIYLARQLGLEGFEKLMVVKRILPHLAENEDFITMFLDEARIAARLNHPNIVQIFDLGSQDETFFIAMEYIHGEDVRRLWKQSERVSHALPVPLICRIIIEAATGLDYAHKRTDPRGGPLNIVHRDISPQNILVSFEGGVKVVDFGIAKAADQATVTRSGVLKGKYSYMSPEQAAGARQIDHRTDIFALGVVMYELLTGTRLFKRGTDIQTLNAVSECKVLPPSEVNPRVPKAVDAIVLKALTKERNDRYPEARLFGSALEDWLLAEKIPSSSAHLASFMQDIYADRLMREAEEGKLLFSESTADSANQAEVDQREQRERPTPAREQKQTKSLREQTQPLEVTAAEPPPQRPPPLVHAKPRSKPRMQQVVRLPPPPPVQPGPEDLSMRTQKDGTVPRRPWWPIAAAIALAVIVVVGALIVLKPPRAHVKVTSEPSGAQVRFAETDLACETPCQLPDSPPGTYSLVVSKRGYTPFETNIAIPSKGEVTLPFSLSREDDVPIPRVNSKLVTKVSIELGSRPSGATVVFMNDGTTATLPLFIERDVGKTVSIRVEMPGYLTISDTFTVTADAEPHVYELKALKKDPTKKNPVLDGKSVGIVRFLVTPGSALVTCGEYEFGETPFKDQKMQAGDYKCTFTSTKLEKSLTKAVKVEANKVTRVAVDFE